MARQQVVLLSTNEAAAILGVVPRTLYRWVREQRITPAKTVGGYVFGADEVARVMALPKRRRGRRPQAPQNTQLPGVAS